MIDMQEELALEAGVVKELPAEAPLDEQLYETVKAKAEARLRDKISLPTKPVRRRAEEAILESLVEELCDDDEPEPATPAAVGACFDMLRRHLLRNMAIEGKRWDGRGLDDIRPISAEVGILPRTHGSAIFQRGETQALVVATLGTSTDEEIIAGLQDEYTSSLIPSASWPTSSSPTARPRRPACAARRCA